MTKYKDYYDYRINYKLDKILQGIGKKYLTEDEDIEKRFKLWQEKNNKKED